MKKFALTIKKGFYPKEILCKASAAWRNLNKRCYDPKNARYENYGKKGIRVNMTRLEFITFYCDELLKWDAARGKASIGRIDHDKNYSMDNICVQTYSENCRESSIRNNKVENIRHLSIKKISKRVLIKDFKTNEPLMFFDSMSEAAKLIGCSKGSISSLCLKKPKYKSIKGGLYSAELY